MVGAFQPFEQGHLKRDCNGARIAQPGEGCILILLATGSNGIDDQEHGSALRQEAERGLCHADMRLHPRQHDLVAGTQRLQRRLEGRRACGCEVALGHDLQRRQARPQPGLQGADSLRTMLRRQDGNTSQARPVDQATDHGDECAGVTHCRQQALLRVYDDQGGAVRGVVARGGTCAKGYNGPAWAVMAARPRPQSRVILDFITNWLYPDDHVRAAFRGTAATNRTRNPYMTDSFADLGLSEALLRAVSDAGYTTPTPIQAKAIPYVLMGRDVLGCAQTGTGKTASFTLPMIDALSHGRAKARMPRSVILEPTRELAAQVAENFETYGKYHKLTMALLIGGVSFGEQDKKLDRGVDVLIATPGRLMDHCERGKVMLNDVKILVIDEADRMLDMGFIPDVEKIVSMMPPLRQTVMFSATMPPEIRKLADRFLSNPKEATVDRPSSTATTVEQAMIRVDAKAKRRVLGQLLRTETIENGLIFCNRKRDVATLYKSLEQDGVSVGALHGDMDQYKRMECLDRFRKGEIKILVCSDVAARGLDIPTVGHVINYDVPIHPEDYVHRIGRTGRAGRAGKAFTIATSMEDKALRSIERLIGKPIPASSLFESVGGSRPAEPVADEGAGETEAPAKSRGRTRRPRSGKSAERSGPVADVVASASDDEELEVAEQEVAAVAEVAPEPAAEPRKSARTERGERNDRNDRKDRGGRGDRGDRGGRRGETADAVEVTDGKRFGDTDLVPAFLRRASM